MENIYVGLTANDQTGDKLRNAFITVNSNFDELALTIEEVAQLTIGLENISSNLEELNTLVLTKASVTQLNTAISGLSNSISATNGAIATKIDEAPINGNAYVRKNGAWVNINDL